MTFFAVGTLGVFLAPGGPPLQARFPNGGGGRSPEP